MDCGASTQHCSPTIQRAVSVVCRTWQLLTDAGLCFTTVSLNLDLCLLEMLIQTVNCIQHDCTVCAGWLCGLNSGTPQTVRLLYSLLLVRPVGVPEAASRIKKYPFTITGCKNTFFYEMQLVLYGSAV